MSPQERRSLTLSLEEWTALEAIANELEAMAERGPTTGESSWRALIRLIAQGKLTPSPRESAIASETAASEGK